MFKFIMILVTLEIDRRHPRQGEIEKECYGEEVHTIGKRTINR